MEKLSCKDLMVGDLVYIYDFPNDNPQNSDLYPAKIVSVIDGFTDEDMHSVELTIPKQDGGYGVASRPVDTCLPVLLTTEILEKNEFYWGNTSDEEDFASNVGCALNEKGWVWDEGGGSVKIIFPNESDGGLIVISDQNFDRDMTITFVTPIYVHELQHLLKFFHIDKDIVL